MPFVAGLLQDSDTDVQVRAALLYADNTLIFLMEAYENTSRSDGLVNLNSVVPLRDDRVDLHRQLLIFKPLKFALYPDFVPVRDPAYIQTFEILGHLAVAHPEGLLSILLSGVIFARRLVFKLLVEVAFINMEVALTDCLLNFWFPSWLSYSPITIPFNGSESAPQVH